MNLDINIAGTAIKVVDNAKYFSVVIDNKLNFQQHLNLLECKVARAVGIMFKLKTVLPHSTVVLCDGRPIVADLLYGVTVWGSTYNFAFKKIQNSTK